MTASWDSATWTLVLRGFFLAPLQPRIMAVFWIRASMWCWRHGLRPAAHLCKARALRVAGVEVHPGATIGPGLSLMHSSGIVIGKQVVAGRYLTLYQGVTLGDARGGDGQPLLGEAVRVGAGAKVLGPVTVGDRAVIGANAVVLADVPAGTTVVGVWK